MNAHNQSNAVQFAANVTAAPGIPAAGAGADLSPLQNGGNSAKYQRIRLDLASGTPTLTGPVKMYGERDGKVYELGELNGGSDIVLASPGGYAEIVQFVGTYDRFSLNPAGFGVAGGYDGYIEGVGVG